MAGGTGTRFWPYSRNQKPKQFLDVMGIGKSLLQLTYERFTNYTEPSKIFIVSNRIYKDVINQQLPNLDENQVLLEPQKRNTAPCIAYAAYKINKIDPEGIMVVAPSDHMILNQELFLKTIGHAVNDVAENDHLFTIGIKPHKPETGYGYIQYSDSEDGEIKKVKTFTEKPNVELADKFIESGDFVWNAGIFVWSIKSIIKSFEKHRPELAEEFEKGSELYFTEDEVKFITKAYSHTKGISIDYAIMEKADNVYVVLGDFDWSDLGSWDALHEFCKKDQNENVVEANTILYDCKENFIKAKKDKLLVLSDLEGYLIADFEDVLLVCKKDDAAKFKTFVTEVKAMKGEKFV